MVWENVVWKGENFMLETLTRFEGGVLLYIQDNLRSELLTPFFRLITGLGNGGFIWILISCLLLLFPKTRRIGCMSLLALLLSYLVNNRCLKILVARSRPFDTFQTLIPLIGKPRDFSFPSGHTASSFAAASVFFRKLPVWAGAPLLILAVLIGISRLYVGVHYPGDVLAGMASGWLLGMAAGKIIDFLWAVKKKYCMDNGGDTTWQK